MLVLVSQKMVDLIFGHVEGVHHGALFSHGAVHNDTNPSMSWVAVTSIFRSLSQPRQRSSRGLVVMNPVPLHPDRDRKSGRRSGFASSPPPLRAGERTPTREISGLELAMSRHLVGNSLDRRLFGSHCGPGKGFHHLAGAFGIGDPFVVELIRTCRDAAVTLTGIDHPLSLIHISEPTRRTPISYAVF